MQNTFTKLCVTNKIFESDEHLKSWLLKVAANECRTLNRKNRRHPTTPYDESWAVRRESEHPHNDAHIGPTFKDINECVSRLSRKHQEVLYLRYVEDCSVTHIARLLGVSPTAVSLRLFRARAKLKTMLLDDEKEADSHAAGLYPVS